MHDMGNTYTRKSGGLCIRSTNLDDPLKEIRRHVSGSLDGVLEITIPEKATKACPRVMDLLAELNVIPVLTSDSDFQLLNHVMHGGYRVGTGVGTGLIGVKAGAITCAFGAEVARNGLWAAFTKAVAFELLTPVPPGVAFATVILGGAMGALYYVMFEQDRVEKRVRAVGLSVRRSPRSASRIVLRFSPVPTS
jgi:hypothetical protein